MKICVNREIRDELSRLVRQHSEGGDKPYHTNH